jgi:hypothetical protein
MLLLHLFFYKARPVAAEATKKFRHKKDLPNKDLILFIPLLLCLNCPGAVNVP